MIQRLVFQVLLIMLVVALVVCSIVEGGFMLGSGEDKWVYGKPLNSTITYKYNPDARVLNISIKLSFRHAGYRVEWRDVVLKDRVIEVYVDVLEYTGPSAQVITVKEHSFTLENIDRGVYRVKVFVNNELFSEESIRVGLEGSSILGFIVLCILFLGMIIAIYSVLK